MATVSLTPGTWADGFGTSDLNSLANGSLISSSLSAPQVDNAAGARLMVQFQVTLASLSPTTGAHVVVFLIPETTTSGTYATGSDGASAADQYKWQNYPYATIALRQTASTGQVQKSRLIQIDPERYKIAIINRSGVAFAASGNQVSWRFITETVA